MKKVANVTILNTKAYPILLLLLVCLVFNQGVFGLIKLDTRLFSLFYLLVIVLCFKYTRFSQPILLFVVSCGLSMASCYFFRGQSISGSFGAYAVYLAIVSFFLLIKLRISSDNVEKTIFYMSIIFCFCYLYQISVYPKEIFISENSTINTELDIALRRIRMPGMSLASFCYFYSLSKFLHKNRIYIIFMALSAFVILLFGFRTLLAAIILFSFILVVKINGMSKRMIIYILFFVIFFFLASTTELFQNIFSAMMERQDSDQTFANKDYIRWIQFYYYYEDHYQNFIELLLGSGIPGGKSNYLHYMENLQSVGIYWIDWGFLGLSWLTGVLSLIGMVWWAIKAIVTKVHKQRIYLTIWFAYIFFCGITTAEFVREGCFMIQGMVLYIILIDNAKLLSCINRQ